MGGGVKRQTLRGWNIRFSENTWGIGLFAGKQEMAKTKHLSDASVDTGL